MHWSFRFVTARPPAVENTLVRVNRIHPARLLTLHGKKKGREERTRTTKVISFAKNFVKSRFRLPVLTVSEFRFPCQALDPINGHERFGLC